jgi:hypothetical protein
MPPGGVASGLAPLLRFKLLDECSEMGGMGDARASYWSLRDRPIADSPRPLSRAGFTLLSEG